MKMSFPWQPNRQMSAKTRRGVGNKPEEGAGSPSAPHRFLRGVLGAPPRGWGDGGLRSGGPPSQRSRGPSCGGTPETRAPPGAGGTLTRRDVRPPLRGRPGVSVLRKPPWRAQPVLPPRGPGPSATRGRAGGSGGGGGVGWGEPARPPGALRPPGSAVPAAPPRLHGEAAAAMAELPRGAEAGGAVYRSRDPVRNLRLR